MKIKSIVLGFVLGCLAMFLFFQIQYPYIHGGWGDDTENENRIRMHINDMKKFPTTISSESEKLLCIKLHSQEYKGEFTACE